MVDLFMYRQFDDKKKKDDEGEAKELEAPVQDDAGEVTATLNKFKGEGEEEAEDDDDAEEEEGNF